MADSGDDKVFTIDRLALDILSALGRDPKGSLSSLSREIGVSTTLLRKKIRELYLKNVLYGVSARINPFTVGLKPVLVFADVASDKLQLFEKACDIHPYTHYRIRCFGPINGVFAAFTLPLNAAYMLVDLLQKLENMDVINDSIVETPISPTVGCETNFEFYNPIFGWRFNWAEWAKIIDESEPLRLKNKTKNVLNLLEESDMRILRELSKDIRRRKAEIARAANVKPYNLSRRWRILEKLGVIQGYRVLVGMPLLQITSHAIIKCECSVEETMKIAAAVKKLPFQSTLFSIPKGFLLITTTTSLDFPSLATTLRRHCRKMETFWCDYRSSLRYYFYDAAFQNGRWRDDLDFMVNSILEGLK